MYATPPFCNIVFFFGSSCLLFFVVVFCIILVFLFVTSFFPFFSVHFFCVFREKLLAGTLALSDSEEEAEGEEEEKEDGGDESAERGRDAPPAYAELSAHFGVLESAAEKSGNADAAHYLSKARMAMILAHAARRTRQADMREFIATE